jgi:hypothetical protein
VVDVAIECIHRFGEMMKGPADEELVRCC